MARDFPQLVAWIDLETTGSNEQTDWICEFAMVVTDLAFEPLGTIDAVIRPAGPWTMCGEVRALHEQSGLLTEIPNGVAISSVDEDAADLLKTMHGSAHVAFAGSGVGHFDRRFIRTQMPLLDKRLTYWALDVGVMRRFFRLAGLPWIDDAKTHRALDDVYHHITEARYALGRLRADQAPVLDPEDAIAWAEHPA